MRRPWEQPKVLSVSALPAGLGDCFIGDSETFNSCVNGPHTGSNTTPSSHFCTNGGIALAFAPTPACTTGGTPSVIEV